LRRPPTVEPGSAALARAAREWGCFYVPFGGAEAAVELAREFFARPEGEKAALGIEESPHFRGYSVMRNERDWREQIHFGREGAAVDGAEGYERLLGPNLWPADLTWRAGVLGLMGELEELGRAVLAGLGTYLPVDEEPYVLLKMIRYHPAAARPGVAAHVDFSWITLLAQDVAGLEVRTPEGEWVAVPPLPGTLAVNVGEILELASGGYFQATPHRVTTGPVARVSLPFFLNPGLDRVVTPTIPGEHVHRVLRGAPLHFGQAEWERKGLGVWCGECCGWK